MKNNNKEPWISVEGAVVDVVAGELQIEEATQRIRKYVEDNLSHKIGFMRQWLNEDRIDDPKKMVDNEQLLHWLFSDL